MLGMSRQLPIGEFFREHVDFFQTVANNIIRKEFGAYFLIKGGEYANPLTPYLNGNLPRH